MFLVNFDFLNFLLLFAKNTGYTKVGIFINQVKAFKFVLNSC